MYILPLHYTTHYTTYASHIYTFLGRLSQRGSPSPSYRQRFLPKIGYTIPLRSQFISSRSKTEPTNFS